MKVRVILNPRAGAGTAAQKRSEIERALKRTTLDFEFRETKAPKDASRLAREARSEGVDVIGIVGGDGTINEVAQAYLQSDGTPIPGPDIALIPAGTGGDFRRTFGFDDDIDAAVQRIEHGARRPIDLGILETTGPSPTRMAFLNVLSFGVSGLVCNIVNRSPKWLGGKWTYLLGGARATLVYKNQPVEILVDGAPWHRGPVYGVAIGNGRYYGGGMQIAPNADPSDGELDVVAQCDLTLLQTMTTTARVYGGTHLKGQGIRSTRGREIIARPLRGAREVLVEADGETPGALPISVRLAAGALRIAVS